MRKFLAVTTAAAALVFATAANAQDPQLYVTQDAAGTRMIMGGEVAEGAPLLMGDAGNRPGDCPAGSFYEGAQGQIFPCEGESLGFTMMAPDAGTMMSNGSPWPEGAMLMQPNGTAVGESGQQKGGAAGPGTMGGDPGGAEAGGAQGGGGQGGGQGGGGQGGGQGGGG
jgi:hypothetical protein